MELIFCLMAIMIAVAFPCKYIFKKVKCKDEVSATVVSYNYSNMRVNGYPMFVPTCSYYYNGIEYTNEVKWYEGDGFFYEGMTAKIKVCKDDPNFAYKKGKYDGTLYTMPAVMSILFFVIGLGTFLVNNNIVKPKDVMNRIEGVIGQEKVVENNKSREVDNRNKKNVDGASQSNKIESNDEINEKKYGSDLSNDKTDADKEYLEKSKMREDIVGVKVYVPWDYELRETGIGNCVYGHTKSSGKIKIYYENNDTSIEKAFEGFEKQLKLEKIVSDTREYKFNNNIFKYVKIRNKYGEYIDVVYSANSEHTVYIEYNKIWGYENIIVDFISSLKY